jgi:hypothetical protein
MDIWLQAFAVLGFFFPFAAYALWRQTSEHSREVEAYRQSVAGLTERLQRAIDALHAAGLNEPTVAEWEAIRTAQIKAAQGRQP